MSSVRADILALSLDDLVAFSNRGTVKRAVKEVQENLVPVRIEETSAGEVTFHWEDGRVSTLPEGGTLRDGRCTCAAAGICRCLIRGVLAYQRHHAAASAISGPLPTGTAPPATATSKPRAATFTDEGGATAVQAEDRAAIVPTADATPPGSSPADAAPHEGVLTGREGYAADAANGGTVAVSWNPGSISDEQLARHFPKALLTRARKAFEQGELVELIRGAKPQAHFHQRSTTIRFLVPGDVRYFHCDCADHPQCSCAPLAVWAFRQLPAEREAGLVSTQAVEYPVPGELLAELEQRVAELTEAGLGNVPSAWKDRLHRAAGRCRKQGLLWPAEIVAELLNLHQQYHEHSALFESQSLATLVGELLIRCDAIRSQPPAVPQLLIRGAANDTLTEFGSARLVGLGCWVIHRRRSVEMFAFLQDDDTGTLVAASRSFENPPEAETHHDFARLSRYALAKGMSLAAIGSGILVVQGAKRTPNRRLVLGRKPSALHGQAFAWEKLRPPLLVDDFAALDAQRASLPPSSLRPRRVTEDLQVLEVADLNDVQYDPVAQFIRATVRDSRGVAAELRHPYTSGGQAGFEALLAALQLADGTYPGSASAQASGQLRVKYVAGRVQRSAACLTIAPTCVVFETPQGRMGLQPWVDTAAEVQRIFAALSGEAPPDKTSAGHSQGVPAEGTDWAAYSSVSDAATWPDEASALLGELLLLGARRADAAVVGKWLALAARGESYGYDRLSQLVRRIAEELQGRLHHARWNAGQAVELACGLAVALRLAMDMPPVHVSADASLIARA